MHQLQKATPCTQTCVSSADYSVEVRDKEVAEQTGVAAGTIRMWEQRYGFPEPGRTASGYRVYTEDDVAAIKRVLAFRDQGLSVPAALEREIADVVATEVVRDYPGFARAFAGA